jgi:hypothetical protein
VPRRRHEHQIRDYQLDHGVARAEAYSVTMYILAGLLVLGLVCKWRVKPVDDRHFMTDAELPGGVADAVRTGQDVVAGDGAPAHGTGRSRVLLMLAWLAIWIPLGWGVWMTVRKAAVLFR